MIIDGHTHSSEISRCSSVTVEELIDKKKAYGYDGVVLTNHCHLFDFDNVTLETWANNFVNAYKKGKEYADKINFKFILGIEVTVTIGTFGHYLLYGITEDFIKYCPCLPKLTQKELFDLSNANGIFMSEAHPLRNGFQLGNLDYMHGIELNCKPCDCEIKEQVAGIARKNNKTLICGTDYHGANEIIHGGMVLSDSINDSVDLAKFLFNEESVGYKIWEV